MDYDSRIYVSFSPEILKECFDDEGAYAFELLKKDTQVYKIWAKENPGHSSVVRFMPYEAGHITKQNVKAAKLLAIPTPPVHTRQYTSEDIKPLLKDEIKLERYSADADTIVSYPFAEGIVFERLLDHPETEEAYAKIAAAICDHYYTRLLIGGFTDANLGNIIIPTDDMIIATYDSKQPVFIDLEYGVCGITHFHKDNIPVHEGHDVSKCVYTLGKMHWFKYTQEQKIKNLVLEEDELEQYFQKLMEADHDIEAIHAIKIEIIQRRFAAMVIEQCGGVMEELNQACNDDFSEETELYVSLLQSRTSKVSAYYREIISPS